MPTHRDYQTVRTEELVGEEVKLRGEGMSWSDTEIIPTTTRSFVVYLSLLLISFTANVLLVLDNARLRTSGDSGKTIYSEFSMWAWPSMCSLPRRKLVHHSLHFSLVYPILEPEPRPRDYRCGMECD